MTSNQSGSSLNYMGIKETNPPELWFRERDPTTLDYKQYDEGDMWVNGSTYRVWVLTRKTAGVAYWTMAGSGSPGTSLVQVQSSQIGDRIICTTIIPYDDTIPQITEGDELLTVSITPRASTNRLYISANTNSTLNVGVGTLALFQNGVTNALAATPIAVVGGRQTSILQHNMTTGTISPITFSLRAGPNKVANLIINDDGGSRAYGGVFNTQITVMEYSA